MLIHIIFLMLVLPALWYVGNRIFRAGAKYIQFFIPNNPVLAKQLNQSLLYAYYLLNFGFSFLFIQPYSSSHPTQIMSDMLGRIGIVLMVIGILHYVNLAAIYIFSKKSFFNY